jgi:hypothetical protein
MSSRDSAGVCSLYPSVGLHTVWQRLEEAESCGFSPLVAMMAWQVEQLGFQQWWHEWKRAFPAELRGYLDVLASRESSSGFRYVEC